MAEKAKAKPKKFRKVLKEENSSTSSDSSIDISSQAIKESIKADLKQAEITVSQNLSAEDIKLNWKNARELVENFDPVPWYIWRLSNFALGGAGEIRPHYHGMIFALKKLLIRAAKDPDMGSGSSLDVANSEDVKKAVHFLKSDVFAAAAIVHSVGRKLKQKEFEKIWKPILEEALLRTRIGFILGKFDRKFGPGRGMLAGFATRAGLAIQVAMGTFDQARHTIERIAEGDSIQKIGREIYNSEPLQVSAMLMIAAGIGRDASLGIMAAAAPDLIKLDEISAEQKKWRAALLVIDKIRTGDFMEIAENEWATLGISMNSDLDPIRNEIRQVTRRGHGWGWLGE